MVLHERASTKVKNPLNLRIDTNARTSSRAKASTPYPGRFPRMTPTNRGRTLKRMKPMDETQMSYHARPGTISKVLPVEQIYRAWDSIAKQVNWYQVVVETGVKGTVEQYQQVFREIVFEHLESLANNNQDHTRERYAKDDVPNRCRPKEGCLEKQYIEPDGGAVFQNEHIPISDDDNEDGVDAEGDIEGDSDVSYDPMLLPQRDWLQEARETFN